MALPGCELCGGSTARALVEFRDLSGPAVTISNVPALRCERCGGCQFADGVLLRLAWLVGRAMDRAREQGLAQLRWAFEASERTGAGEVGAVRAGQQGGATPGEAQLLARASRLALVERALALH